MPKICPLFAASVNQEYRAQMRVYERVKGKPGNENMPVPKHIKDLKKSALCVEHQCQMWDPGVPDVKDPQCGLAYEKGGIL